MGLKPKFTDADIKAEMTRRIQLIQAEIVRRLQYVGEQCVIEARTNGSYQDRTANLRNSVGYIVTDNGAVVHKNFEATASGIATTNQPGGDPAQTAQDYANSLAGNFPKGYALIVVAGMNYAAYVEAKGYNVLSSAESLAKIQVPNLMTQLKTKIAKMK